MDIADYILDTKEFDWPKLLRLWKWRLPDEVTIWFMNRFGDLFCTVEGRVFRLSLDDGSFDCLGESRDDFCTKLDISENANDWLLIPIVDDLVREGKLLGRGECYAFTLLPILGGDYEISNIEVREVSWLYAALGPIFEKLKDIPDGTQIQFRITD